MAAPAGGADLLQTVFQADQAFPEYLPLWWDGWPWEDEYGVKVRHARPDMPLGGHLKVYFRNDGNRPIEIADILIEGISVSQAVAPEDRNKARAGENYFSSIQFSNLSKEEIERITTAGDPVWWKPDPASVPPGAIAEVTVRLRREPKPDRLNVEVVTNRENYRGTAATRGTAPRILNVSFAPGMDRATLYLRHPSGKGLAPTSILMDGQDLTGRCTMVADEAVAVVPVVLALPRPTREAQYHCFQAIYADGSSAIAGLRAWEPEFRYGMWGWPRPDESPEKTARNHLVRMQAHHINTLMWSLGEHVLDFAVTDSGQAALKQSGIRLMHHVAGYLKDPLYLFLTDEPDAADFGAKVINPPDKRLGATAQSLVEKGRLWRKECPGTLQLLNTDATFQPEQYYTYAQLADVGCFDRYYAGELQGAYERHPADLGEMTRPTSVYAAGRIFHSVCSPKPMHIILTASLCNPEQHPFRAPTPEEKRVEVYYALAAGAKGLSYWWYAPYGDCPGVGGDYPGMPRLLNEIGILGAEVRTAGAILSQACPADLALQASRDLWVRSLLARNDTIIVVAVNDNIAFDRAGAVVVPAEKARIEIRPPAWMQPGSVFEISSEGTRDAVWNNHQGTVTIELGTVELTRLIVLTSDGGLRQSLQKLYQEQFAANVRQLVSERVRLTSRPGTMTN
ncbi:MAG TPA: hypothetical protein VLM89_12700 [Phycisphaerae bacterium]|nr:hypothetical protein [Phycisphaerae bacterium]